MAIFTFDGGVCVSPGASYEGEVILPAGVGVGFVDSTGRQRALSFTWEAGAVAPPMTRGRIRQRYCTPAELFLFGGREARLAGAASLR